LDEGEGRGRRVPDVDDVVSTELPVVVAAPADDMARCEKHYREENFIALKEEEIKKEGKISSRRKSTGKGHDM
jgi:hypothetical protein